MKRGNDRRTLERREGKRGVTVRHSDERPEAVKRVRRGKQVRKGSTK